MLGSSAMLAVTAVTALAISDPVPPLELPQPSRRTVKLSPADMFRLAEVRRSAGDVTLVATIYGALENDPNADIRAEARFRHAKLLLDLKRNTEAAVLLRRLLDEKPGATMARLELAQVLDRMGDRDGAWRQVRAAQAAGLPPNVARLVDRYSEALRAARPFGTSLEIALAPDTNINRATRSDTLGTVIGDFEIDQDSKAKSGTGLAVRSQTYRRFGLSGGASLLARLSGSADLYREKEFNDVALDFAAGPELELGKDRLNLELGATQRWYGQKSFLRSARVGASVSHPFGQRALVRANASAALVDNRFNNLQDGKVFSADLSLERALTPTTGIVASAAVNRESLKDPGYSTTGWRGGLTLWRDVGRVTLTGGVEIGRTKADQRLALFPERRSDHFSRVSIGASFRQIQWRGFAPVARLSIERNRSTVEFYDYRRTRTEIGIVRAF